MLLLLPSDPEKEEMMKQLDRQYGGCVYVTRKLRKHEKEAKERTEAAEAAAAAAARASNPGEWAAMLQVALCRHARLCSARHACIRVMCRTKRGPAV